jgi:hypothetical protein
MARRDRNHPLSSDQPPTRDWPETVVGAKYLRLLDKEIQGLRDKQPHGNRDLFLDDVFVLSLLAFHNPTLRSLRILEDFSQSTQAQRQLTVDRIPRSTLSDFHKLADPERLQPIIQALREQLVRKQVLRDNRDGLAVMLKRVLAVDGTWMTAMTDVLWAVVARNQHAAPVKKHRARIDFQVDVRTLIPDIIAIPDPGESESESAARHIQPGCIHVYDRGFSSFALIAAHYDRDPEAWTTKAEFVIRYKPAGGNSPELQGAVERPLTDADRAAGVVSDRTGTFRSSNPGRHVVPPVALREVVIETVENGQASTLRLITNLLDLSAATIGLVYRQRWQVELFFRWLKSVWNFRHLVSHNREGLLTQMYVTLVGVMLMYLHTGYRPSKYMLAMLSIGAELDDILPILRERERQCEVARLSAARRWAAKQAAKNS